MGKAVNYKGKESEQSKARRKKRGKQTAEESVKDIRSTPTNRMPTKGTDFAKGVKDFFSGKKTVSKGPAFPNKKTRKQ